jgi:hypothetical protein
MFCPGAWSGTPGFGVNGLAGVGVEPNGEGVVAFVATRGLPGLSP